MAQSKIEWTKKTWNPLAGCTAKSAGCLNCYAATMSGRLEKMGQQKYTGVTITRGERRVFNGLITYDEKALLAPLSIKKPDTFFVNSMSDLWWGDEEDLATARRLGVVDPQPVPFEFIDKVFAVMALCPQHIFQILTKRPERMKAYVNHSDTPFRVAKAIDALTVTKDKGLLSVKPIPGYPGYFADSYGEIYSDKRGSNFRKMKPDKGKKSGHLRVQLHREGQTNRNGDRHLVHRLILETFVGPAPSPDAQGKHRDGNPANNALSNLSWGDQSSNWEDRKRHGNFRSYSKLKDLDVKVIRRSTKPDEELADVFKVSPTQIRNIREGKQWAVESPIEWPLPNCWLGVSVENQEYADKRIPLLLDTPAAVRWISAEPLLGPIDLKRWIEIAWQCSGCREYFPNPYQKVCPSCSRAEYWSGSHKFNMPATVNTVWPSQVGSGLNWGVIGGESGPRSRPCDIAWIRSIVGQCKSAGVPVFVKQLGAKPYICIGGHNAPAAAPELDGRIDCKGESLSCRTFAYDDRKGGSPEEWPEDLRVREFPNASTTTN